MSSTVECSCWDHPGESFTERNFQVLCTFEGFKPVPTKGPCAPVGGDFDGLGSGEYHDDALCSDDD